MDITLVYDLAMMQGIPKTVPFRVRAATGKSLKLEILEPAYHIYFGMMCLAIGLFIVEVILKKAIVQISRRKSKPKATLMFVRRVKPKDLPNKKRAKKKFSISFFPCCSKYCINTKH